MISARSFLGAIGLACLMACAGSHPTEFVIISFTPSVDTDEYRVWDFELASCRDFNDPRVDDDFVRAELLAAIQSELEERGYERRPEGSVDFTVFYELRVSDGEDQAGIRERMRGRIIARDVASQRLVWLGERKAPVTGKASTREQQTAMIRRFAQELLQYIRKLEEPEKQQP
jgi:hypothetical protein